MAVAAIMRMVMTMAMTLIMVMVVMVERVIMIVMMVMTIVVVVVTVVVVVMVMMIVRVAVVLRGTDPFHVMMVAFLDPPDLRFVADRLFAILAHLAVHLIVAVENLAHPLGEGIQHQRMIVEVARLQELDLGVTRCHLVGDVVDALH